MVKVRDILHFIESVAPAYMKEDWDNVGLLCGSGDAPVTKILVALDPFEDVCREAVELGAQLIVTHHPLIFMPTMAVTDETAVGRCVMMLCRYGISAINAHTNLDCAPGGVNDTLAQKLGLQDVQIIDPKGDAVPYGLLRSGTVEKQPLAQFLATVKKSLGCKGLKYADGGKPVRKVAVGGGACASELLTAHAAGCDTFVTSDVKYNGYWDAKELGMTIIDAGHFHTENPVVSVLAEKIAAAFPELTVKISEKHDDCANFF